MLSCVDNINEEVICILYSHCIKTDLVDQCQKNKDEMKRYKKISFPVNGSNKKKCRAEY